MNGNLLGPLALSFQPELRPMLLPIFVHSYLDLVEMGYGNAGELQRAQNIGFAAHH